VQLVLQLVIVLEGYWAQNLHRELCSPEVRKLEGIGAINKSDKDLNKNIETGILQKQIRVAANPPV